MLLYYSPAFLEHQTGKHPENPGRIIPAAERLLSGDSAGSFVRPEWTPISQERLLRVHSADYLETVRQFAAQGGGQIEADTVVSLQSLEVAKLAAGAVCDAVERVVRGEDTQAFCLIRPPGHHALPTGAMGFCLLGNVALGARMAIDELGLDRVLIVDWDVHHGNGTQEMFWEDPQVGFLSIHRYPFYPGTGAADETGSGRGLGTTLNVPIAYGTPRRQYLAAFTSAVQSFAERVKPQLVLISAGFDAHRQDPIGSLGLESEDFLALANVVREMAAVHAAGRIVSVLEGGYHPQAVAQSALAHVRGLGQ